MIINLDEREREVKLKEYEIDQIVDELERVPHNLFKFFNYDKIIRKLKTPPKQKKEAER